MNLSILLWISFLFFFLENCGLIFCIYFRFSPFLNEVLQPVWTFLIDIIFATWLRQSDRVCWKGKKEGSDVNFQRSVHISHNLKCCRFLSSFDSKQKSYRAPYKQGQKYVFLHLGTKIWPVCGSWKELSFPLIAQLLTTGKEEFWFKELKKKFYICVL